MTDETFDVVIIGGGPNGMGIAAYQQLVAVG